MVKGWKIYEEKLYINVSYVLCRINYGWIRIKEYLRLFNDSGIWFWNSIPSVFCNFRSKESKYSKGTVINAYSRIDA